MKSKNISPIPVSQSEAQLLERLRQHPEMMERVQSILDIAYNTEGPLKSADQVEELLIQEMRRLGSTSRHQWATQAEQRVSRELKAGDGTVRSRKKNTEVVLCLWLGERSRLDLVQPNPELLASSAPATGRNLPRTVQGTATGAHRFWQRAFLRPGGRQRSGTLWI
jgi:hypothetical protein